ncbi:hypothetical protein Leryth_005043 [Lithospermum erythrorhizon]|nr:hypothetical protein Leryth_005043 [Lithospermum erythrorhizon]
MGRKGSALVFLTPKEEAYVYLQRSRKSPLKQGNALTRLLMHRLHLLENPVIQSVEEYDELDREYSLIKKLKKGKIDETEFANTRLDVQPLITKCFLIVKVSNWCSEPRKASKFRY